MPLRVLLSFTKHAPRIFNGRRIRYISSRTPSMAECYNSPGNQVSIFSARQHEQPCSMWLKESSLPTLHIEDHPTTATYFENACCAGVQCQFLLKAEELYRLIWDGELCTSIDREVCRRVKKINNEACNPRSSVKLGTEANSDQRKVQERTTKEEQLDKHLKELGLSRSDYNELKVTQLKRHKAVHPALQVEHAAQAWKQSKRAGTKRISQ